MTQMKVNEHLIRISGSMPIDKPLELGKDVEIAVKGAIVQKRINDNQDGSVDIYWVLKPLELEIKE